jgi:hypothetical protein
VKRHLLRVCSVVAILAFLSLQAEATPIQTGEAYNIAFRAETCDFCWPPESSLPNITIQGLMTVVPVTSASFWDPLFGEGAWQSALLITGIDGTLSIDCQGVAGCSGDGLYDVAFAAATPGSDGWSTPRGDGSYLLFDVPRYSVFSAVGSGLNTRLINDNAGNLFQWASPRTGFGTQAPVTWTATKVPEPSSLAVFSVGVAAVLFLKSRRRGLPDSTRDPRV